MDKSGHKRKFTQRQVRVRAQVGGKLKGKRRHAGEGCHKILIFGKVSLFKTHFGTIIVSLATRLNIISRCFCFTPYFSWSRIHSIWYLFIGTPLVTSLIIIFTAATATTRRVRSCSCGADKGDAKRLPQSSFLWLTAHRSPKPLRITVDEAGPSQA